MECELIAVLPVLCRSGSKNLAQTRDVFGVYCMFHLRLPVFTL